MLLSDKFLASSLKLPEEATDLGPKTSMNVAVPEIATGLPRSELSIIGTVYVICDQAEKARHRGTRMALGKRITPQRKTSMLGESAAKAG